MYKDRAKKAAIVTGKGLGFLAVGILTGLAALGEEQERQRKIREHTDALKALQPDQDILFVRKA